MIRIVFFSKKLNECGVHKIQKKKQTYSILSIMRNKRLDLINLVRF